MRHRNRKPHLSRPADQRNAMLRSIATAFFIHGSITTTHKRAKAVQPIIDKVIGLAKRGDVHAIRQVSRLIYNQYTGGMREDANGKLIRNTVLRTIFRDVVQKVQARSSGYTRVVPLPPRRGDATVMGFLQLVEDAEQPAQKSAVAVATAAEPVVEAQESAVQADAPAKKAKSGKAVKAEEVSEASGAVTEADQASAPETGVEPVEEVRPPADS